MTRAVGSLLVCAAFVAALSGCVAYPYPAYYYPPVEAPPAVTFDRAWYAALGAFQDAGVGVTTADQATGVIRGIKDQTDVSMTISRQANGAIRADIEAKGPQDQETGLTSRVSAAYQRRLGL
jgi:hypothetical protein